jgi:hypothetical protein
VKHRGARQVFETRLHFDVTVRSGEGRQRRKHRLGVVACFGLRKQHVDGHETLAIVAVCVLLWIGTVRLRVVLAGAWGWRGLARGLDGGTRRESLILGG